VHGFFNPTSRKKNFKNSEIIFLVESLSATAKKNRILFFCFFVIEKKIIKKKMNGKFLKNLKPNYL